MLEISLCDEELLEPW